MPAARPTGPLRPQPSVSGGPGRPGRGSLLRREPGVGADIGVRIVRDRGPGPAGVLAAGVRTQRENPGLADVRVPVAERGAQRGHGELGLGGRQGRGGTGPDLPGRVAERRDGRRVVRRRAAGGGQRRERRGPYEEVLVAQQQRQVAGAADRAEAVRGGHPDLAGGVGGGTAQSVGSIDGDQSADGLEPHLHGRVAECGGEEGAVAEAERAQHLHGRRADHGVGAVQGGDQRRAQAGFRRQDLDQFP